MVVARAPALFDLTSRVALVTGGNGGIGRAIALGLADAGAAVAIIGRDEAKNEEVVAELEAAGARCLAFRVDVTERASLKPAFDRIEAGLGAVDILVNNAGIATISGGVLFEEPDDWDKVMATNLDARVPAVEACGGVDARTQGRQDHQHGQRLLAVRLQARAVVQRRKGAVIQLTRSMAIELAPYNIQVNAIAPGWIETEMTVPVRTTPWNDEILARVPAGRWGQPEEIAGTAVYLARTLRTSSPERRSSSMAAMRSVDPGDVSSRCRRIEEA
jgi:2-deoxy-D-gluconate 3-dehydrogenase